MTTKKTTTSRAKKTTKPAAKRATKKKATTKRATKKATKTTAKPKTRPKSPKAQEDPAPVQETPLTTPPTGEGDTSYRVWKLDQGLKDEIKESRERLGATVQEFWANAIHGQLANVVKALEAAGVGIEDASTGPVRVPHLEESLKALRYASAQTGLDQSQLIVACLRLECREGGAK